MKYQIEKGVSLPVPTKNIKYPFKEMGIGDSFIISNEYSRALMTKYSNAARNFGNIQNPKRKFSLRKVEENKLRVWRIK